MAAVVEELADDARCVAVDLRDHGRSTADSSDAEGYWRDLAVVADGLHLAHPVLVGHSTGGYAVTAAQAAGLLALVRSHRCRSFGRAPRLP